MKERYEEHQWIWIGVGAAVIALVLLAVAAYDRPSESEAASARADQVIAAFEAAGLRAPDKDQIVGSLGDDGGAVCDSADSDLGFAELNQQLANGAAQVGLRPVIVSGRVLVGQSIIISIYCPEHKQAFDDYVAGLEFEDVIKD